MSESGIPNALQEKNDQEFVEVTRRIQEALARIENNHKLKATQDVLAQLADCSRGTLNNRRWPLERLKEIKAARRSPKLPVTDETSAAAKVESQIDRYKEQLYNSREEVLVWKSRHDEVSRRLAEAMNLNRVIQGHLNEAEEKIANLRRNNGLRIVEPSPNQENLHP